MRPEDRLAAHLMEAVKALQLGEPERALLHLRAVLADADLGRATSLADVRARACTLFAQASFASRHSPPLDEVEAALDWADAHDPGAAAATASLRATLAERRLRANEEAAREARTRRLAEMDIAPVLARMTDPERRVDLMTQKSQADVLDGRADDGRAWAQRALEESAGVPGVRSRVMALLCVARVAGADAAPWVLEALRIADAESEHNLVATVARTAELLGVALPVQRGPAAGTP